MFPIIFLEIDYDIYVQPTALNSLTKSTFYSA